MFEFEFEDLLYSGMIRLKPEQKEDSVMNVFPGMTQIPQQIANNYSIDFVAQMSGISTKTVIN